jgi:hypothetical protein
MPAIMRTRPGLKGEGVQGCQKLRGVQTRVSEAEGGGGVQGCQKLREEGGAGVSEARGG